MARETAREVAIQTGVESAVYQDQKQIVRTLGQHLTEAYMFKVTGAGGVGGTEVNVPFRPAYIECWSITDLSYYKSWFASDAAVHMSIIDTGAGATDLAANATPPVITRVGEGDYTIALPVGMAPNASVLTCIAWGFRDIDGGL